MRYYYDLHIHSCLSPCGDGDMTVNNIAGMSALKGLQIAALTDHNSCKNCPAFFTACRRQGVVPVAGMELTTAEEIHLVCLFEHLEDAMAFDERVEEFLPRIKNRPDIFGRQQILDAEDNVVSEEDRLLINATTLMLEDAWRLCEEYGGVCFPAHVDRDANGIIAILGSLPPEPPFVYIELHDGGFDTDRDDLRGKSVLVNSDAHYLYDINEAENFLELPEVASSADVRKNLFTLLRKGQ